jgi:hypothetical protein
LYNSAPYLFSFFYIFLLGVATAADDTAAEASEHESNSGSDGDYEPSSDDSDYESEFVNIVLERKCNYIAVYMK